jgi:hypothetical protein
MRFDKQKRYIKHLLFSLHAWLAKRKFLIYLANKIIYKLERFKNPNMDMSNKMAEFLKSKDRPNAYELKTIDGEDWSRHWLEVQPMLPSFEKEINTWLADRKRPKRKQFDLDKIPLPENIKLNQEEINKWEEAYPNLKRIN